MLISKKQTRKVRFIDNIFRRTIVLAGIGTILCVLAILWSIAKVIFPLFYQNKLEKIPFHNLPNKDPLLYLIPDKYLDTIVGISNTGELFLQNTQQQKILEQAQLPFSQIFYFENIIPEYFFFRNAQNSSFWKIRSEKIFDEQGETQFQLEKKLLVEFSNSYNAEDIFYDTVRPIQEQSFLRVSILKNKKIDFSLKGISTNFLGQQQVVQETFSASSKLQGNLLVAFLARDGKHLYLVDDLGMLENFALEDWKSATPSYLALGSDKKKITALNTIFGETSLLVGFDDGSIETFAYTRGKLVKINERQTQNGSIVDISASLRNKSFFTLSEQGSTYWYLTNNNKIFSSPWKTHPQKLYFNTNGSAIMTLTNQQIGLWKINAPHPDFSFAAIFQKIKYEGYLEADYIWQSSSGNDDFEPKYSFIPLIIGSIKGTLYAMIFALPLSILGAIYVNQFAKPWLRNIVKPSIEIMATVPSVVIGFLAALWLAPLVRDHLFTLFLYLVCFPIFFLLSFFLFYQVFKKWTKKYIPKGAEFLSVAPSLICCFLFVVWMSFFLQENYFGGDFVFWLSENFGVAYDQRNAVIISFALGFAIIPIIFTMTDEALSSFPRSLTIASFALGANHWQTLMRVILPTTASGIFAGFIIGFGRAIGETMIVLMATGNSPITSWSFFNGMRTISANIAVEIPEAPLNETLYRLLFFSAVLLFLLTFILNLIAELIRSRLRKKYRI